MYRLPCFPRGTENSYLSRGDILDAYVCPYASAIGNDLLLQDDRSRPQRAHIVEDYLQNHIVECMVCSARSLNLNLIKRTWDALERCVTDSIPFHKPLPSLQLLYKSNSSHILAKLLFA